MKSKLLQFALIFFIAIGAGSAHSAAGPHGGKISPLQSREHRVLPGYSVELIDRSRANSKKKKFEIYLLKPSSEPVDLMNSGYWAVSWRTDRKQGRLRDNLAEEKQRTWKEEPPYTSLFSFIAEGEIPKSASLEIEVAFALPGKGGTGVASFALPTSAD